MMILSIHLAAAADDLWPLILSRPFSLFPEHPDIRTTNRVRFFLPPFLLLIITLIWVERTKLNVSSTQKKTPFVTCKKKKPQQYPAVCLTLSCVAPVIHVGLSVHPLPVTHTLSLSLFPTATTKTSVHKKNTKDKLFPQKLVPTTDFERTTCCCCRHCRWWFFLSAVV